LRKPVTRTLNLGEESVSVGIEDVEPKNWTDQVYRPDILGKTETIYKKPGYEPL
jgi:4-oxalocrotonate tautomerase